MQFLFTRYSEIGGRTENEDSVAITPCGHNIVTVVADGLGGQGDGKTASQSICDSLMRCGEDGAFPSEERLRECFRQANRGLMEKQQNHFHMKSTAVYLCLQGGRAIWAHVGDSRLYHLYGGKICDYTLDHSAAQLAVLMGNIKREEIPRDASRNRLLRAMGDEEATPEVHEAICLLPGTHGFLLCSDGLWESLTDENIEEAFCDSRTASACLNRLREIRMNKKGSGGDNHSAVVILARV